MGCYGGSAAPCWRPGLSYVPSGTLEPRCAVVRELPTPEKTDCLCEDRLHSRAARRNSCARWRRNIGPTLCEGTCTRLCLTRAVAVAQISEREARGGEGSAGAVYQYLSQPGACQQLGWAGLAAAAAAAECSTRSDGWYAGSTLL